MNLAKMTLLTEADDLFDIDKEVDAQIKRVENRISRKNEQEQPKEQPPANDQQPNEQDLSPEEPEAQQDPQNEPIENQDQEDPNLNDPNNTPPQNAQQQDSSQDGNYEYMDNGSTEDIPEDYEPKQTIPELKILNTLSDSEYALCNVRILEDFRELRKNVDSIINNIIMTITTKNARQRQVISIVHNNLNEMLEDIDNYIIYRNKDVYEENVIAYLTYLKRYRIATNLVKLIVDENLKADNDIK